MAWTPSCSCTTGMMMATFGRCAPTGARLTLPTTLHLRPSRAPTTWTSWSTTAGGDRALLRRSTAPPACKKPGPSGQGSTSKKELEFKFDISNVELEHEDHFRRNYLMPMRGDMLLRDPNNPLVDLVTATGGVVGQIPRLRPQQVRDDQTPVLLNLTLRTDGANVTLSVRTDNLYVIGFRNRDGAWFEFTHDNQDGTPREGYHMIQGSILLPFSGRYDRQGIGGLSSMTRNIFSRGTVNGAIWGLANHHRDVDNESARKNLRILIVNFIESVRFVPIGNLVAGQMRITPTEAITDSDWERFKKLIHNWSTLSERSMLPGFDWSNGWSGFNINSLADVAQVLGMALVRNKFSTCNASSSRGRRDTDDDGAIRGGGMTLAEVVEVVIVKINDQDPGFLYGTITVTDGLGDFPLYNRDKDNYQEVGPGGKADLLYAPRPISGADDFIIDVDLLDHYRLFRSDRKVAVGQVNWNSQGALSHHYNTILKVPVKANPYGEVEVQYAVMTDAMVAVVEVVVVNSNNFVSDPRVYGSVTARITMASGKHLWYTLFYKAKGQRYQVTKDDPAIPLERKLVSVPNCSKLEVYADLWDHNWLESDDEMANRSAPVVFTPHACGTKQSKSLDGGKLRVDVTWSGSFSHQ